MPSDLYFAQLPVGEMQNFAYLIGSHSTRECLLVDPAWAVDALIDQAERDGLRITGALVTHYHQDHVGGRIFNMEIEGLARLADVILIDAPPITLYPDARAIAPLVDGVILVVEADSTPVSVAARATEILRESGANILGVVLNKTRQYIPERFSALIG